MGLTNSSTRQHPDKQSTYKITLTYKTTRNSPILNTIQSTTHHHQTRHYLINILPTIIIQINTTSTDILHKPIL